MIRLYVTSPLAAAAPVAPKLDQSRYLTQVMRLKAGDDLLVFNGRDGEWRCTVAEVLKKGVILRAEEQAVRRRLDELRSSAGVRPGKFPPEERERRRKAVERIVEQLHRETTQEQRDAMANADDWLYDEMGLPK